MKLTIDHSALELTFRMLLTCGCPVTGDEERSLFHLLQSQDSGSTIDYARVLSVFSPDDTNVFHGIRDFYVWQAPVHAGPHTIRRDHIIRHFSSSFHWDNAVARGLEAVYGQVKCISSWFLSHMLLPARVTQVDTECVCLSYDYSGGSVQLLNLFAPEVFKARVGDVWAVHFAGLLDRLSPEESDTARFMLEENRALKRLRTEVDDINYLDFERKGNYAAVCRKRCKKYYKLGIQFAQPGTRCCG